MDGLFIGMNEMDDGLMDGLFIWMNVLFIQQRITRCALLSTCMTRKSRVKTPMLCVKQAIRPAVTFSNSYT